MTGERVHVPVGEALLILARGIMVGQLALDHGSYRMLTALEDSVAADEGSLQARLFAFDVGLVPVLYQFVETVLDLVVSISLVRQSEAPGGGQRYSATMMPIGAAQASVYRLSTRDTSRLRVRLMPCPPPVALSGETPAASPAPADEHTDG